MYQWNDNDWLNSPAWDNVEAGARLEAAGYCVLGWRNGRPLIDPVPEDWGEVQRLCLGTEEVGVSLPLSETKTKRKRRGQ